MNNFDPLIRAVAAFGAAVCGSVAVAFYAGDPRFADQHWVGLGMTAGAIFFSFMFFEFTQDS